MVPLVSVIVPVYNAEKYLDCCLDSIASQTMTDFEVLLIDDGSTDGSADICRRFERSDPRFRYFHKRNSGAAEARNLALDKFRGEWVCFVDSDDELAPSYLEGLLHVAHEGGSDIVLGGYTSFSTDSAETKLIAPEIEGPSFEPSVVLSMVLYQNGLDCSPWGKLFKRRLFDNVRFPPLRSSEDLATIYKPFFGAVSVAIIRDTGYRYRLTPGSLSYSAHEVEAWRVMRDASEEIVARYPDLEKPCCCRRLSFAFHVFLIADDCLIRDASWSEIRATRRIVICDRFARRKARVAAAVSFFGQRTIRTIAKYVVASR